MSIAVITGDMCNLVQAGGSIKSRERNTERQRDTEIYREKDMNPVLG